LDTLTSSATHFAGKWDPALKRNQSRDVLRLVIAKLCGVSHGHVFSAHVRASHAALGDTVGLSREWTCKLIARLREAGWIRTEAPRLPDGTQEITIFRPGRMLKRLLVMLLKSKQRQPFHRVNDQSQQTPLNKDQVERNKTFLRQLVEELAAKRSLRL
jgi:hypothetical protein